MTFKEYQEKAKATALYPSIQESYVYPALGLTNEAGEVAGKIKKIFRDNNGKLTDEIRHALAKEIGDVMWYVAQLSTELGLSLEDVAQLNIDNLAGRKERGTLHGSGDNR